MAKTKIMTKDSLEIYDTKIKDYIQSQVGETPEGVTYVDPDDTSTEIEEIDNVTSAKLVSYSNADSNIEATNVQDAIDVIGSDIDDINTELTKKVNTVDIIDNLGSTATDKPLSAKQGKILKETIEDNHAENLIRYPYYYSSGTNGGITWTDNGDGTVIANGTVTETCSTFLCHEPNDAYGFPKLTLPAGTYTISGCPSGGGEYTYFVQVGYYVPDNDVWQDIMADFGGGATFTLSEETSVSISITIINGVTVNNLVFKPMLEVGTVAHEYKPYSSTKVTKGDIVDNLLTGRADLPLSAKQGVVINDFLNDKFKTVSVSTQQVSSFSVNPYGAYLLFCQWASARYYAMYYVNMPSNVIAKISSDGDIWTVTISSDRNTLYISNENSSNYYAQYHLLRVN